MPLDSSPNAQVEIGHVLFTDIVGYSKLLTNQQRELLQLLNQIVRETGAFRTAEAAGKLVRLPTGDGMALAFFNSPDAPVRCAMAIGRELKNHPELKLRMGIHSGPVDVVFDVNDRPNIAGAGINMAQRVMDCGDAGHILLSKRSADDLAQYREWKPYLHDLGEMEVKHGVRLGIVSFYNDEVGNPKAPDKLTRAEQAMQREVTTAARRKRRRLFAALATLAIATVLIATGIWAWQRRSALSSAYKAGTMSLVEKSIAVLPFENFESDKESAYFADGVQDDILTDLAKVADLKVISRRSVAQYRGSRQGIREIGQALQVAYVLEGTVRRIGDKISITAQLIDTRTEVEKWAEKYTRDLSDLFAVQNQISETIVAQLKATLTSAEKRAIESPPTDNLEAYDLFLRARAIVRAYGLTVKAMQDTMPEAEKLLEAAVTKDPKFVLAWCLLAEVQWTDYTGTLRPERRALAEASLNTAFKLAPDSGEVRLTMANYYYGVLQDRKRGEEEFTIAARQLPNSVDVASGFSGLAFDQGRWKEALDYGLKATQLDPRDPDVAQQLIELYADFRRYSDADKLIDRTISILPPQATGPLWRRKGIYARERGDTKAAMAAFDADPYRKAGLAGLNFEIAQVLVFDHRFDEALALIASLEEVARTHNVLPRGNNTFAPGHEQEIAGIIRRAQGQSDKAREAFTASEQNFSAWLQKQPDEAMALAYRAVSIAGQGRKEEALREARQAMEIWPPARDRAKSNNVAEQAAVVHAWTGDHDAAIRQLQAIVSLPHSLRPGDLKLNPQWNELRRDPRFSKIVAEAEKPVKIE